LAQGHLALESIPAGLRLRGTLGIVINRNARPLQLRVSKNYRQRSNSPNSLPLHNRVVRCRSRRRVPYRFLLQRLRIMPANAAPTVSRVTSAGPDGTRSYWKALSPRPSRPEFGNTAEAAPCNKRCIG